MLQPISIGVIFPSGSPEGEPSPPPQLGDGDLAVLDLAAWPQPDPDWPHTAWPLQTRLAALERALAWSPSRIWWAGRGGYGASELLDLLPWEHLATQGPGTLLGFSDCSALLIALHCRLGWVAIHAPMPFSQGWKNFEPSAQQALLEALLLQRPTVWPLPLYGVGSHKPRRLRGRVLAGCLSVLTGLVGSPYFTCHDTRGKILLVEDVAESPPRIVRMWSQWKLAGYTQHLRAVVVGSLVPLTESEKKRTVDAMRHLTPELPFFSSDAFGHGTCNTPIFLGSQIELTPEGGRMVLPAFVSRSPARGES